MCGHGSGESRPRAAGGKSLNGDSHDVRFYVNNLVWFVLARFLFLFFRSERASGTRPKHNSERGAGEKQKQKPSFVIFIVFTHHCSNVVSVFEETLSKY